MTLRRTPALLLLAALAAGSFGCSSGDDDSTIPDYAGTWNWELTFDDPCAMPPVMGTPVPLPAVMMQTERVLVGTSCDALGNLWTFQIVLHEDNHTAFTGTLSGCNSQSDDCMAPFDVPCLERDIVGQVNGLMLTGVATSPGSCQRQLIGGTISP